MFSRPAYAKNSQLKVETLVVIALFHLLALLAPFTFTWAGLITFIVLVYATGTFGITLGYHRLLTHNGFKTVKPIKYFFVFVACLALQGGPIFWVSTHRLHHKESDQDMDPHTPKHGFWWAHMIWNFYTHPLLDEAGKNRYAMDLQSDPVMRFFEKYFFGIFLAFHAALYAVGYHFGGWHLGLSLVIWGGILRTVYVWHVTWLVNSATHIWGYQNYALKDDSKNAWWVALLTYGEGWHNNHHSDQRSARHGHLWYEIDLSFSIVQLLEKLGLVSDVIHPRLKRLRMNKSSLGFIEKAKAGLDAKVPIRQAN